MNRFPVTMSQLRHVRDIANAKHIGHDLLQDAIDDGLMGKFFESLLVDTSGLNPPKGGTICTLDVEVIKDIEWQSAINSGSPDTPMDHRIRSIADQYVPKGKGRVSRRIILLNLPCVRGSWHTACAWADSKGLRRTNPREVFAIGKTYSQLHRRIAQFPMCVVATKERISFCGSDTIGIEWFGGNLSNPKRTAQIYWTENLFGGHVWFAFRTVQLSNTE